MARGHVQHRGGDRWRVQVYAGTDERGRRRRVYETVHGTRKDAERVLNRLLVSVDDGRATLGRADLTFGRLLDEYLELAARDLSPTTVYGYRCKVDAYVRPALGGKLVRKLRTSDLDRLYGDLTARGLKPRTIRQTHAILRRALAQAVRWDETTRNVALDASPPKLDRITWHVPTVDDVGRVLAAALERDDVMYPLLVVAVATGARRGELVGLRWGRVNLEAGTVRIARTVTAAHGQLFEKGTKTDRERVVAIDGGTVDVLRRWRARQVETALMFGARIGGESFVFAEEPDASVPIRPDQVTRRFRELADSVGVACRFHDLRHHHASTLLAHGVTLAAVSDRIGHAAHSTTLNFYAHAVEEHDRQAADLIGRLYTDGRQAR